MRSAVLSFSAVSVLTAILVLVVGRLPAQRYCAAASGTLDASPLSSQAGGLYTGPITSSWVHATASHPGGQWSFLIARQLGRTLTVEFQGSGPSLVSDYADIALNLYAPAHREVHLQVSVDNAGTASLNTSILVTGQSLAGSGLVTNIPANGVLPIDVLVNRGDPSTAAAGTVTLSWSYPSVASAGPATPGCSGSAEAWIQGDPLLGNGRFGITCAKAPPSLGALSIVGLGGFYPTPLSIHGVDLWVDLNLPVATLYHTSDAQGNILCLLPIPFDYNLIDANLWAQFVLVEPPGCTSASLSASNAIWIVVDA